MNEQDQIKELEAEMRKTQYNKATEHHFGIIKAKIAKLRQKMEARKSSGPRPEGIRKSGDATVVIIGFPSSGKSTLLNVLTSAKSKTGAYAFTTLKAVPGIIVHNQAKIQVLDVPGILEGAAEGKGRGTEVLGIARNADFLLIVVDANSAGQYEKILHELYAAGIRVNEDSPDISVSKRSRGGIVLYSTVAQSLDNSTIKKVLAELKVVNAEIILRESITIDRLIDAVEGNKVYVPAIVLITKSDLLSADKRRRFPIRPDLFVSAQSKENISVLKELIFERLGLIRIFMKEVNKKPDLDEPMILRRRSTLRDVCNKIHRDFERKFNYAKIWGKSAKFPGQQIKNLDKLLCDGDIVEIRLK